MISALFCIYVELDEKIKNYIRMELLGQRYKYLYDLNLENNAFLLFISVDLVKRKIRFWVVFFFFPEFLKHYNYTVMLQKLTIILRALITDPFTHFYMLLLCSTTQLVISRIQDLG